MSVNDVARHLLKTCNSLKFFECFMFGSSLLGVGTDYDILVIGPAGEALIQLKAELKIAGAELPLDILYMLPKEAEETDFIVKQKCVSLSHLVTLDSLVV
ncbi:hypothetical protein ACU27_20865 [Klebsiella variicola]|jgi:hypothetical protein|nr:hypothetical protein AE36_02563 [Klebsiella variicola]PMT93757.1 hypothetical protein AFB28_25290 [Klebsiella sp. Kd70 TUC-EEAOC]KNB81380.1 hypothetical protein AC813_20865 [Klebsiella variicola]KNB86487.1 hypothetical protein AC577_22100 [Klebsiella variicola]OBR58150.1 hypothetical protein ACU27_20865 [Klebsiella variicola]